ncbi:MAG: hypothetical protein J6031_00285, partial [Bacteroidales bacterium]|nr:hypothetical protein [Bacteroidales bacterium]
MKKIIIVLALLATGVCCRAQIDTLFLGDRNPVYYYWDTNWWDYYALLHKNDPDYSFNVHFFTDRYCKPEWARYCYTDSSLRIIGVAASMHIKILRDLSNPFDTIPDSVMISDVGTEHFRLYEVDSLTDSMMLLAEGLWSKEMQPSHYIINAANPSNTTDGLPRYKPVYEVYFDSAFTVSDSFYVAVTGNGFYRRYDNGHYRESYARAEVCNVLPQKYHTYFDDNECRPRPEHYRRKLHLLDEGNYDWRYGVTDTNWHTFGRFGYHPPDTSARWNVFMSIFPIIDTSTVVPPPDCRVP